MRPEAQIKLLDTINDMDPPQEIKPKNYNSAIMVHIITKMIPLGLLGFSQFIALLLEQKYLTQMILLFIALDFWLTKNVIGKRLLGYWWFFGEDQYGQERLMYECRGNAELVDPIKPKLFWIVQFIYILITVLFIAQDIFLFTKVVRIELTKFQLNLVQLAGGVSNFFYFLKISDGCDQRQNSLRRKLGMQYVRKLGLGSITSHY